MPHAGRHRNVAIFGVSSLIDAVGTGTYLAGSALYFTRQVGLTPSQVGLGITLSALLGLALTVPWGHLAHRYGARRIYLVLLLSRAACFAAFAVVPGLPGYLLVSCLLGTVDKPTAPVQQELVGVVTEGLDRQRVLAWIRAARNLGFVLGSGVAGTVAVLPVLGGYRAVVLVNAASFVLAAALTALLPRPARPGAALAGSAVPTGSAAGSGSATPGPAGSGSAAAGPGSATPGPAGSGSAAAGSGSAGPGPAAPGRLTGLLADRRYLALTAVNGVLTSHMALLGTGLPLWLISRTSLPPVAVPVLAGVNAAVAMAFQVPVAARIRTTFGAARALVLAGVLLAGCCAVAAALPAVAGAAGMALAVLAVLLLTAAELVQSGGGWQLSFDLAPEYGRAVYLARFSLGVTLQLMAMPVLLTALVFPAGAAGWAALAVTLAGAGVAAPRVLRIPGPAPAPTAAAPVPTAR